MPNLLLVALLIKLMQKYPASPELSGNAICQLCRDKNYPIIRMHWLHAKKNVCNSCNNSFLKMMGIVPVMLISIILLINQTAYRFINFYPFLLKVTDFKVKFVDGRLNNHWKWAVNY